MPLSFVLDEHLRGPLWRAVRRHNAMSGYPIDMERVGDPPDLPRGSQDPDILAWAEANDRLIVTFDAETMPGHFKEFLAGGRRSPGVLIVRSGYRLHEIVEWLVIAAYAGAASDFEDQVTWFP